MTYGVQPTGFVRKPLGVILAEIEAALITEFGPGLIQTAQSPLGQINGTFAELVARYWEEAEDIYQSYDPDQAEGARLDILGRLRVLTRSTDEGDDTYRRAITNTGRARIDIQDLARAVAGIAGVTYSHVFVNDSNDSDEYMIDPHTVAVAVLGGDDATIAATMRRFIVPGISSYGNTSISTDSDGYCRTMRIVRPNQIPVSLVITVRTQKDSQGCPPPSSVSIRNAIVENLNLLNGENVSWFKIRSLIEGLFPTVEVMQVIGEREGNASLPNLDTVIDFEEIATFSFDNISIVTV